MLIYTNQEDHRCFLVFLTLERFNYNWPTLILHSRKFVSLQKFYFRQLMSQWNKSSGPQWGMEPQSLKFWASIILLDEIDTMSFTP